MATKTGAPAGDHMPEMLSTFPIDLDIAAKLGAQAKGVEIATIVTDGLSGLPMSVPVALTRGEHPQVGSLHRLLEEYRVHPARKRGTAEAQTFDAFCEMTNRHKTDHSAIFADATWTKPSFTAVIDYHEAANGGQADFCQHRIRYDFPLSDEWRAWIAKNGEAMSQQDFAWFLEDRVAELAAPTDVEKVQLEHQFQTTVATPAQVVELSRGLTVAVAASVKAHTTLQSGEGSIQFDESHNDGAGQKLKVPGIFILDIAPFFMGETIRVPVRLRYRVREGKVMWFYQIYRPDLAITEHVRHRLFDARDRTALPAYEGKPEGER
ncbi:MAG: YfdQ family protein [Mesorhizobium sp.]|nr:YfdQ family protein [Mesorhizobium sp.]